MRRTAVALMFFSFLVAYVGVSITFAKAKEKTFDAEPQELFQVALRVAMKQHNVTYVDEKHMLFTFQTGMSGFSWGFAANAMVESAGTGKSVLSVNVQKKQEQKQLLSMGAGGRMVDKFFDAVKDELAREQSKGQQVKKDGPR